MMRGASADAYAAAAAVLPGTGDLARVGKDLFGTADLLRSEPGLRRVATDASLRERLGAAARRRYLAIFHPDAVLPLLLHEYQRLIGSTRQNAGDPPRHPWRAAEGAVPTHGAATGMFITAVKTTE